VTGSRIKLGLVRHSQDVCTAARVTLQDTTTEQRAMAMVENLVRISSWTTENWKSGAKQARLSPTDLVFEVINGGTLKSNNKGVNVPSMALELPALTAKDYEDLEFFLEAGARVGWVAVSFVQRAQEPYLSFGQTKNTRTHACMHACIQIYQLTHDKCPLYRILLRRISSTSRSSSNRSPC